MLLLHCAINVYLKAKGKTSSTLLSSNDTNTVDVVYKATGLNTLVLTVAESVALENQPKAYHYWRASRAPPYLNVQ